MSPKFEYRHNDLPHDSTVESLLIGSLLLDSSNLDVVIASVESFDFFETFHQLVFSIILELAKNRHDVDLLTVSELMKVHPEKPEDFRQRLNTMAMAVVSTTNIKAQVRIVHDMSVRRRVIRAGTAIVTAGFTKCSLSEVIDAMQEIHRDVMRRATIEG